MPVSRYGKGPTYGCLGMIERPHVPRCPGGVSLDKTHEMSSDLLSLKIGQGFVLKRIKHMLYVFWHVHSMHQH